MKARASSIGTKRTLADLTCLFKRNWLGWLLALLAGLAGPVLAQPLKGSVYKDFLPLGSGSSVALPEGSWEASQLSSISYTDTAYEVYTLKNLQPGALVPFLVVHQSTTGARWGNTQCLSTNPHQFMVHEHGTRSSELLNKCSRIFAIGNFDTWRTLNWATPNDKKWWSEAVQGMVDPVGMKRASIFQAELTVQEFNGKKITLNAFVLPPKGMTAGKFRDDYKADRYEAEQPILAGWISIYIESIHLSYFNKKPQPIMALAYPVNTVAQSPTVASAASVMAPAQADPYEKESAQRTQDLLRELAAAKPTVAQASAPLAAVAQVKPTPAPPAVLANNAAQLRLEQERRAMNEDKRKLAQQLEVMGQMLAKLQQENSAAAAANKAKELAAAAALREAAVSTKAPVIYAHRKALVIGNDLYTNVSKLNKAGADAEAMSRSLEAVGYKVFLHLNLNEKGFKQAVRDFRQQLSGGDEVLFFYAGHGVQLGNANYLLPIDVKGDQEDQVKDEAILLQKVLDDLEAKKTKFTLAVIDACRDNPFKDTGRAIGGRGLAPTTPATGQMIMFSAGSGQQALENLGDNDKEKNGLFTRIFVKEMVKPGLSVDRVLRNVRNEVVRLAKSVGREQTPALYDQAIGEFYFKQ